MTRRQAIRHWLGATAAVVSVAAATLPSFVSDASATQTRNAQQRAGPPPALPQPRVLKSTNSLLALTLTAMPATVDMGAPSPVRTLTYDGVVPGYTWELNAGDRLTVDLVNRLPPQSSMGTMRMDRPHEWATTNLHTHGLHVSPLGNGDNVFLTVQPGDRQHYQIDVPPDHPSGIFWYHPHRHGGVTQQVRGGMAGLIIVRGDLDQVPEVAAATEQVMILQAIELGDSYELLEPIPNPTTQQAFYPRTNVLYTVNGVLTPTISMYPGEVQRWRLLNAAEGKFMSLRLEGHAFNVLAWDGLTLAAPDTVDLVMLSAGNRVEVLVRAGQAGTYELMLTPGSSQKPNIPGMPDAPSAGNSGSAATVPVQMPGMASMPGFPDLPGELQPRSIATVVVGGDGPEMDLPNSLPAWDPPILPIARQHALAYTVARSPDNEFIFFGVDGDAFDPTRPPYQIPINTAEEWTLTNDLDTKLMDHAHVFHIHQNPFKITSINGAPLATPLWRDTFVLTRSSGDSITFESNFVDYPGTFVQHCHVLSHEDLGMMSSIEIIP
ncbi:MAG: multicopper oxidase domain-containing protein [Chloroflexi bacterium]|nr:multicopper oxidase domain-containing protein [Chloroflexota bacterium]